MLCSLNSKLQCLKKVMTNERVLKSEMEIPEMYSATRQITQNEGF